MTGSVAIDIVIGLVFVFLLYSLLTSVIQEIITKWLGLRQRMLVRAIARMLDDSDKDFTLIRFVNLFFELFRDLIFFFNNFHNRPFSKKFYDHPNIKYLGENSYSSKPSYLNPSSFSLTLIDILRGAAYDGTQSQKDLIKSTLDNNTEDLPEETLRQIKLLFNESKGDVEKFRFLLEHWFNEMMDRCSGWFKTQTQFILFLIGLFIAYQFNVDTLAITKILANDKNARENMVNLAIASAPEYSKIIIQFKDSIAYDTLKRSGRSDSIVTIRVRHILPDTILSNAQKRVRGDIDKATSILGLGWPDKEACLKCDSIRRCKANALNEESKKKIEACEKQHLCTLNPYQNKGTRLFGWILTALAISLGAPFWFDLLNKIIMVRSSIKPLIPPAPNSNSPSAAAGTQAVSSNERVG